jgi:two-component system sensor histidine kinase ChiS
MIRQILDSPTSLSLCFRRLVKLFVIGSLIILYFAYQSLEKELTSEIREEVLVDSIKLTTNISNILIHAENITSILAKTISREDPNNLNKLTEILRSFSPRIGQGKYDIFTITLFNLINPKGQLVATSNDGILKDPIQVSDQKRSWIKDARIKPWRFHVAKNDIGLVSKEPVIPVGFGFTDKNNNFSGIVSIGINAVKLKNLLESSLDSRIVNFAILNDDGSVIITSTNFDPKIAAQIEEKIANKFSENQDIKNAKITLNNQDFFYSKISLYSKLGILVGYDKASFNSKFWSKSSKTFFYLGYFIIFTIILLFLLKKRLLSPITSLSKIANKISNKNFNFYLADSNIEEVRALSQPIIALQKITKQELDDKITLKKNHQSKKDFLSSISNEFSNITNSIIGISEFIKSDIELKETSKSKTLSSEDIEEYKEFLEDIKNLSDEILLLAQDIVDINHSHHGIFEVEKFERVDLEQLTTRCIKLLRTHAIKNQKMLSLNLIKDQECNFTVGNLSAKLVKQALVNIIRSIIKYAAKNSKIELTLEALDNEVSDVLRDSILKRIRLNTNLDKDHRNSLIKVINNSRPKVNIITKFSVEEKDLAKLLNLLKEEIVKEKSYSIDQQNLLTAKYLIEMQGGFIDISINDSLESEIKITF